MQNKQMMTVRDTHKPVLMLSEWRSINNQNKIRLQRYPMNRCDRYLRSATGRNDGMSHCEKNSFLQTNDKVAFWSCSPPCRLTRWNLAIGRKAQLSQPATWSLTVCISAPQHQGCTRCTKGLDHNSLRDCAALMKCQTMQRVQIHSKRFYKLCGRLEWTKVVCFIIVSRGHADTFTRTRILHCSKDKHAVGTESFIWKQCSPNKHSKVTFSSLKPSLI